LPVLAALMEARDETGAGLADSHHGNSSFDCVTRFTAASQRRWRIGAMSLPAQGVERTRFARLRGARESFPT
jgi:hypothetical protein